MDIAALSMELSALKVSQNVNIAIAKKAMAMEETKKNIISEMIEPNNHILDVKA